MDAVFPIPSLAYGLLALSIIALWFRPWWWLFLFACFLGVCLWQGLMTIIALIPVLAVGALFFLYTRFAASIVLRISLLVVLSLLSVALGVHAFPGFTHWNVVETVQLSNNSASFTVRYFLDKPLIGLLVLGLAYANLIRTWVDWRDMLNRIWKPLLVTLAIVYSLSAALGYTRWDPTFSHAFWPWAIKNLLFVCVAEEAFFRGFLQRQFAEIIPHRNARIIGMVVAALLFGVAHIAGGLTYVLLATVAGLGYGYIYHITQRVEAAILTHFLLNSGHFLLFTYPYQIG